MPMSTDQAQLQPRLPHIIFDFGGVVFRWHPATLLARVLPRHAPTPEAAEQLKAVFFQNYEGDWGAFDSGLISADEVVQRISARTNLTPAEVQAVVDAVPDELAPQAGTVALMQVLKAAGHRLFYLSNMPAPYAEHLERTHAFMAWFERGVFSSRVRTGKPGRRIYELALADFGIPAADALFIDDHPVNIEAATALGLPALLFTTPEQLAADLRQRGLLG
ncbi:HAD family hydrolase [Ideonella margarita]|uniref:HAD family phosphatase n=1 Tax=Ideonella margarita TaxID=2984191 RepID=A0ABU9C0Q2_9BURK